MIHKFLASMANPPQTVSTTKAEVAAWQPQIHAVGTLRAVKGADLSLEVPGIVDKIDFRSGEDVQAGTELLMLRDADDAREIAGVGSHSQSGADHL